MKKYGIIYIDPPWEYKKSRAILDTRKKYKGSSKADDHYPTMSLTELKKLLINEMLEDNALVFMWTTGPLLKRSIRLGTTWGLQYATIGFVWDKQQVNPGNYTMSQIELCLIFKKGAIPTPRGARNVKQFLSQERREHSRKPDEVRRRIDEMFPDLKKLEMFARSMPDNDWDAYGNEVNRFRELF